MKKFLTRLILFFAGFLLVFISVAKFDNVARCQNKNDNVKKLVCQQNFDSLDIVFLGNSYCYSGINPIYFDSAGIKTFNLGVSTAGVNYYSVLINDYLKSAKQKPKSIFLLVSPMTLSEKTDDALNNPIYRYTNHPLSVEEYMFLHDPSLIKSYPKIIARSFSRTFVNLYTYFTSKQNYCDKGENEMFASKGFISSSKKSSFKDELKTNRFFLPFLKSQFDTVKAKKFLDLASELEGKNIKVVFYELPSNKLYSFFNATYLHDYASFITKLKQNHNFIFVDLKLKSDYYRDQDHLNADGATIASKEIIKQIKERKDLCELYPTQ
ncbi:MAG TPA: hypothetical protein VNX01_04385 [Bacteroidia bacterium]|nr:hypothetical protein [Bacteroidia bacterium]